MEWAAADERCSLTQDGTAKAYLRSLLGRCLILVVTADEVECAGFIGSKWGAVEDHEASMFRGDGVMSLNRQKAPGNGRWAFVCVEMDSVRRDAVGDDAPVG